MFDTDYLRRSVFFSLLALAGILVTLCGHQPWFALLAGVTFVMYATLSVRIYRYARIGRRCIAQIDATLAPLRESIDLAALRSDCPFWQGYLARRDIALSEARTHASRYALSFRVPAFRIENRIWDCGFQRKPA